MITGHFVKAIKEDKTRIIVILYLGVILILGGFVRLVPILSLDFPLNDGGAFYQMILDLKTAGYALPVFTGYNKAGIPYSYPPLSFYIAGSLSDLFNLDLLSVLRFLPAMISILTIPAFYFFARKLFPDYKKSLFATFAFALLPTSFDWLVVGGGLSRSFGYLFVILFFSQFYALLKQGGIKPLIMSIIFATLTLLSHPGTAFFACYGSIIILFFHWKESDQWFRKVLFVGLGTLLLASPWWLTVLINHGFRVFIYPFQTENPSLASILTPFTFLFTNEPLLDILAFLGLIGVFICLKKRGYFLPAWLFLIFLFESRLGATYAVLPMSLLVSVGIVDGFLPILMKHSDQKKTGEIGWVARLAFVFLGFYAILNAYLGVVYQVVTEDQGDAMDWISKNTPEDSQFLVLSGTPEYGIDPVSEWFPTLSQRHSLTTPQLHEWLPNQEFSKRVRLHADLQQCLDRDFQCIEAWAKDNSIHFSHVYIPNPTYYWTKDAEEIAKNLIYNEPGGMIWARR